VVRSKLVTRWPILFALSCLWACRAEPASRCSDFPFDEETRFTDVTAEAGIAYLQWELVPADDCLDDPYSFLCVAARFTGGATVGDYDGDGWDDLYVTRLDGPDILYRNRGDGTFEDVTLAAGLGADLPTNGAVFGDVDDDGHLDLLVTTVMGDRWHLYINQGDGTFVEEAVTRGVGSGDGGVRVGMSGCFGDYDRDGWPDLHVNEWYPLRTEEGPESFTRLFHNRGAVQPGHFDDVTDAAGVDMESLVSGFGVTAFASSFTDLDDDGWPDLIVVSDFGQTQLFWNRGDGTFLVGTPDLGDGVPSDENGMGLAVGDIDGDGLRDWFVTSIYDDRFPCPDCAGWGQGGNRLYRNLAGRRFEDVTDRFDVRDGGWGWGAAAFDYDNDGLLDLIMTNGHIFREIPSARVFEDVPIRLWRNEGADPMSERAASAGIDDRGSGKALVVFDYDGDGDLDVFVVNNAGEPRLFRNDGPTGCSLRVKVRGRGARNGGTNLRGLGARVEVRARPGDPPMVREMDGACGYLGQHENVAHFGLGAAQQAHEVRVRWPATGRETVLHDVPVGETLTVTEPD
jgi:enediyne biosynthesis protein E4